MNSIYEYRYLDKSLFHTLCKYNCPNIVFRKVWLYIPNHTKLFVNNLQEQLYKHIIYNDIIKKKNKSSKSLLIKNIAILLAKYNNYSNIINLIRKMEYDQTYKHSIFNKSNKDRVIKMGPYVHLRDGLKQRCLL